MNKTITPIEVHDLASIVPMADKLEQEALNKNIADNGFKIELGSILLYQGQIVDGRCRQIALIKANLDPRDYAQEIDADSYDEVVRIVKSANTRRNLTTTQKAISAYNVWSGTKELTQEAVAESWGVGLRSIKNVASIVKSSKIIMKSPLSNILYNSEKGTGALLPISASDIIKHLLEGSLIKIDENKPTDALKTIAQNLKAIAEKFMHSSLSMETYEWNPESPVKSEQGKQIYYPLVQSSQMSVDAQIVVLNLVNTVYPNSDEKAIVIPLALAESFEEQIVAYRGNE